MIGSLVKPLAKVVESMTVATKAEQCLFYIINERNLEQNFYPSILLQLHLDEINILQGYILLCESRSGVRGNRQVD